MALIDGLLAVYHMDGDWLDAFDAKPGSPIGDPTFDAINKKLGSHAGSLDGNDYIDLPTIGLSTETQPFSILAWIRPTAVGSFDFVWCNNSSAAGDSQQYFAYLRIQNDGTLLAQVGKSQVSVITAAGSTVLSDDTFYLTIIDFDGIDTLNIYLDNSPEGSGTFTLPAVTPADDWVIGAWSGSLKGAVGFKGQLDESIFWNRVLTSSERSELWNGGAGLAYPFSVIGGRRRKIIQMRQLRR